VITDLTFDESFFNAVIIALVIGIVIIGALAGLKLTGVLDGGEKITVPVPEGGDSHAFPDEETEHSRPVAGQKTYSWDYLGENMTMHMYISNTTYQDFVHRPHPADTADTYVVADGDGGTIETVSTWFLEKSRDRGWGDYETVSNVLAFAGNITYTTGQKNARYPVETLIEEKGDSTDHAVLAAAVLHSMGYGVSLLHYPPAYDRGTIIPEATALGIVCDDSVPGRRYQVEATVPAGRLVYHPVGGTVTVCTPPTASASEDGWYAGKAVWSARGNLTGSLGEARYYPANRGFVTTLTPDTSADYREKSGEEIVYTIEDAVWTVPLTVSAAWTVDTEKMGTPRSAYDGQVPVFIGGEGLWCGRTLTRDAGITDDLTAAARMPLGETASFTADESVTDLLRIPTPDRSGPAPDNGWPEGVDDYSASRWVPSGVQWTHDASWKLFDHALDACDDPALYDPWGGAHVKSPSAWRIAYRVREMDETHQKKMTPYSDVRFAVYRVDEETGQASLDRTFGWQSRWGAEEEGHEAVFGPGTYEIAVFVRNCNVDVEVQYSQKADAQPYGGRI
jgi:hypothetical protein